MKKSTVKHILIIGAFLLVVAAVAVVVYLLTYTDLFGHEDYSYHTDVMHCGYDPSIDGYRVEKFESYDSFKGSSWKDRDEISPKKYGEDFFAENNLVIFSFNYPSEVADFFLVDVVGDRESQELRFVCVKSSFRTDDRMASYCACFVTKEPLAAEYTFKITETYERRLDSALDYMDIKIQNDSIYSDDPPEIYHIDSLEAADRFVAEDPFLEPHYRLPNRLRLALGTDEENDVWVVRASFFDSFEVAGAYMEGDELVIWSIEDWTFKNVMHKMTKVMKEPIRRSARYFTVTLPKGESIRSVRTVKYREFDDPAPHFERATYALVRDESSAVIKYNIEEAQA